MAKRRKRRKKSPAFSPFFPEFEVIIREPREKRKMLTFYGKDWFDAFKKFGEYVKEFEGVNFKVMFNENGNRNKKSKKGRKPKTTRKARRSSSS